MSTPGAPPASPSRASRTALELGQAVTAFVLENADAEEASITVTIRHGDFTVATAVRESGPFVPTAEPALLGEVVEDT